MKPRRYDDLTEDEAEEHLQAYVAGLPGRVSWLRSQLAARGGPELDGSPESLVPLWRWVVAQEPDLDAPRSPDDGSAGDLPAWVEFDAGFLARWGPWLLQVADGLVAYVADVYAGQYPGTRWVVHRAPERVASIDQNRPVLRIGGDRGEVNLPHVLTTVLHRAVVRGDEGDRADGKLRELYRTWSPKEDG